MTAAVRTSGLVALGLLCFACLCPAQDKPAAAAPAPPSAEQPDTSWFTGAKFGLFIHWGLYSALGNEWRGKLHHGSAEWIMHEARIPATDYAALAKDFNPVNFDADEWARFARESGARYLVITAKHHDGFAMFGSKVSPFNIVDATPWHRDPMVPLAAACRREGLKFGFYYSQFFDWHEPDGGGNGWDFVENRKDYQRYYAAKAVPQLRELLSNYGPLGLLWFDMPGGLSRAETATFIAGVRRLQPQCLISGRVGQGLGDFRDFADSELPPGPVAGPWEMIFTHNDSWGYDRADQNFKTPVEILRLLASAAARGGNLLLNVGPDGTGRMPALSLRYLREVGRWLARNGESIYGTTCSPIPDQPWGVMTLKPGRLYLHVFTPPADRTLVIPGFTATVLRAHLLGSGQALPTGRSADELSVTLPPGALPDARDSVVVVEFSGGLSNVWRTEPALISRQFESFSLDAAAAELRGGTDRTVLLSSRYFGNWQHDTCITGQRSPDDRAEFSLRVREAGDYRVTLEYSCPSASKGREGLVEIGGRRLAFQTLFTGESDPTEPLLFIRHAVGIVSLPAARALTLAVYPRDNGTELFRLRRVVIEPVR